MKDVLCQGANVFQRCNIRKKLSDEQKTHGTQYQTLFYFAFIPALAGRDAKFVLEGCGETVVIAETEHFCNVPNREDGFFQ